MRPTHERTTLKPTTLERTTHCAAVGGHLSLAERVTLSRRAFLIGIPSAMLPFRPLASQLQEFNGPMAAAQDVYRPVRLAPRPGIAPSMTQLERDALERRIKCQCGGCTLDVFTCRTTDFSCTVSPAMHRDVMGLVAGGHSAQEILAAFQAVYGEKILMAPLKSGFSLLGYTVPFLALGAGAVIVAALIRRWKSPTPGVAVAPATHVDATEGELAALDAAVRQDR